MSKLGLALALVTVLGLIGWSSHIAVASQQAQLRGIVTANGETPPQGVEIVARLADGTECDRTILEEGGAYRLALSEECPAGSSVLFILAATEDEAVTEVTVEGGIQTVDIAFEDLSPESLQTIGLLQAEFSGTVTVNGGLAPRGVGIIARRTDGAECGRTTMEEDGTYRLALSEECPAGIPVLFFLAATEDRAVAEVTVEGGIQTVDIAFEDLPPESLQAIGLVVEAAERAVEEAVEEVADEALKEAIDASLLTQTSTFVILLVLVVAVTVLVSVMVLAQLWAALRGVDTDKMSFWRHLEVTILALVIVAVIILGLSSKVDQEGLVAILGAIAGYGAGRAIGGAAAKRE